MKLLGLLGGMSWESTTHYYQALNRMARDRLGGQHSARLVMWSVDFGPMAARIGAGEWAPIEAELVDAAKRLEGAGAEAIVICTNTMHRFADEIGAAVSVPLIHIADATAGALKAAGLGRPLLLATRPTMEQDFYKGWLADQGVAAVVPDEAERVKLNAIIFDEMVQGVFREESRVYVRDVVARCWDAGVIDSVVLGCTEFGLLTPPNSFEMPVFDTAQLHCEAASAFAFGGAGD